MSRVGMSGEGGYVQCGWICPGVGPHYPDMGPGGVGYSPTGGTTLTCSD